MPEETKIQLLVVESDADCRELISKAFLDNIDILVADTAPNGSIGLIKAHTVKPAVILLDTSLPDFTPEEFTEKIFAENGECGIILTVKNGAANEVLVHALKTLEAGAFDFIVKPGKTLPDKGRSDQFIRKLVVRIRACSIRRYSRIALKTSRSEAGKKPLQPAEQARQYKHKATSRYRVLVIGVSTGGPRALFSLVPQLPADFPLPVVVVIHLPGFFTAGMALELDKIANLEVKEAAAGEALAAGRIYLAHGGRHLLIESSRENRCLLQYNDEQPVNNCRPAVDVLFKTAAAVFRDKAVGVILTGMGSDGAEGIKKLKEQGAVTIAQDKESSVVWGMPGAAVATGCVDYILPLESIIPRIMELI